jgi:hypothetical protein
MLQTDLKDKFMLPKMLVNASGRSGSGSKSGLTLSSPRDDGGLSILPAGGLLHKKFVFIETFGRPTWRR